MTDVCPTCRRPWTKEDVPPEPPLGTWVRDRYGGVAQRFIDGEGNEGWSEPGFYALGKWEAMWKARGPLVECGPWGRDQ